MHSGQETAAKPDMLLLICSKHVELELIDGTWFALDLQSSNGTKLNESTSCLLEGTWLENMWLHKQIPCWNMELARICSCHLLMCMVSIFNYWKHHVPQL